MFKADTTKEFVFVKEGGYDHLVYRSCTKSLNILSKSANDYIDITISFSYLFIINFIFVLIWFLIMLYPYDIKNINLKTKIQAAMISLLFISLVFIGGGSIYYSIKQIYLKKGGARRIETGQSEPLKAFFL